MCKHRMPLTDGRHLLRDHEVGPEGLSWDSGGQHEHHQQVHERAVHGNRKNTCCTSRYTHMLYMGTRKNTCSISRYTHVLFMGRGKNSYCTSRYTHVLYVRLIGKTCATSIPIRNLSWQR